MALPTNRATFKQFCLNRLGAPVIKINVDDDQVEQRIDYALLKFRDYHFDGQMRWFLPVQITQADQDNRYVTIPDNVNCLDVVGVFDVSSTLMGAGIWNVQYQWVLSNLDMFRSIDLTNYVVALQGLQMLQQILAGKQAVRHDRYGSKLYVDMDWTQLAVGDFIVLDMYVAVDAADPANAKIWTDPWLMQYSTAQMKQAWGNNMKKYDEVVILGGVKMNGQRIYDEATQELADLEAKLMSDYSYPVMDFIG